MSSFNIFMGMPGNPAPVPISIKLLASPIGEDLNIFIQSIKCFLLFHHLQQ